MIAPLARRYPHCDRLCLAARADEWAYLSMERDRPVVLEALERGEIEGRQDEETGRWRIDRASLDRWEQRQNEAYRRIRARAEVA